MAEHPLAVQNYPSLDQTELCNAWELSA